LLLPPAGACSFGWHFLHSLSLIGRFSHGVFDAETDIGDELASFEIMARVVAVWKGFTFNARFFHASIIAG
jgi:hypothetical protein